MMIDAYGTDSMFYFTYFFQILSLIIVFYLPTKPSGLQSPSKRTHDGLNNGDNMEEGEKGRYSPSKDDKGGSIEDYEMSVAGSGTNGNAGISALSTVCAVGKAKLDTYLQELRQFVKNRCCRVILFNAILYGACMQTVDTWLFICLEQDYHANKAYWPLCFCFHHQLYTHILLFEESY